MNKILVTGANGQLGNEIRRHALNFPEWEFIFTDIEELDVTNLDAIKDFFYNDAADYLINCAAYTAVDKAETEKERAFLLNSTVCRTLALAANEYSFKLFHISTDFVFDGMKNTPCTEEDNPNPLCVYGSSKLTGEYQILEHTENYFIIRTSWLYSSFGSNFVKTMIKKAKDTGLLNVVYDQVGTPTYAGDLADLILHMIDKFEKNMFTKGIYNYSNEGAISWYDFARTITDLTGIKCQVNPLLSTQYHTRAKRPAYSVLDKAKIKNDYGIKIPYWKDSLKKCIKELEKTA
jgi:dTDP-4-dehydrorhamnose reductase